MTNITPLHIEAAARWLAATPHRDRPKPFLPYLRDRFGLTPAEIIEAIRRANEPRKRGEGHALGGKPAFRKTGRKADLAE